MTNEPETILEYEPPALKAIAQRKERTMDQNLYLGIDPGQSGGIAVLGDTLTEAYKMPSTERDLADLLEEYAPYIKGAAIEAVHSFPKQGVASSFAFGRSYGFLRGLLIALRIPFREVAPGSWQRAMGCLTKGDKNVSKARAQQMWPKLKITHATADSLLIAEWARRTA